jgi:hypothetical protein
MGKLKQHAAYYTCDEYDRIGPLYYFAPSDRTPPPYTTQRRVEAILDIASDGTLAGVELVFGDLPPPPFSRSHGEGKP